MDLQTVKRISFKPAKFQVFNMSHLPYYGQTENRVEYNAFSDEYFITIPDDIVEKLGLKPGDVLEWCVETTGVRLVKK